MTTTQSTPSAAGTTSGTGASSLALRRPPRRPRRRGLAAVTIALLILIPAGYIVLSAYQSRDSGEEKARAASARMMVYEWPTKVERRIYDVPIPGGVTHVGHYETNAWESSTLYVQFRASPGQLDAFLSELGTTRSALNEGTVTIPRSHADVVGWVLDDPSRVYAGTIVRHSPAEAEVAVTVDITHPERARVHVASTYEP